MLSGQLKSVDEIPQGDYRHYYPRFQPENFAINLQLVNKIQYLADERGCTPAQLAINWTKSLSKRPGMPSIIPIPGSTLDTRVRENSLDFNLTEAEMAAIDAILAKFTTAGNRYPDGVPVDG
jgi:pyridoxine 4-dehydrogenase